MRRFVIFLLPFLLIFLAGCVKYEEESKAEILEIVPDYSSWVNKITAYYAREVGFNFPFILKFGDYNISGIACLASFTSDYFAVDNRCTSFSMENSYIYVPPSKIRLTKDLDRKIEEKIIVNFCYKVYDIFKMKGCISKEKRCNLAILTGSEYPIKIKEAWIEYNGSTFILNMIIKYDALQNQYVSDNLEILNSKCFLNYIDNIKDVGLNLNINVAGKNFSSILSIRRGEEKIASIPIPGVDERREAAILVKFSYIVLVRKDFGRIIINP